MMPRCFLSGVRVNFTAQRIVAPVNRQFNSPQSVRDHNDRASSPADVFRPFHTLKNTQAEA